MNCGRMVMDFCLTEQVLPILHETVSEMPTLTVRVSQRFYESTVRVSRAP